MRTWKPLLSTSVSDAETSVSSCELCSTRQHQSACPHLQHWTAQTTQTIQPGITEASGMKLANQSQHVNMRREDRRARVMMKMKENTDSIQTDLSIKSQCCKPAVIIITADGTLWRACHQLTTGQSLHEESESSSKQARTS